MKNVLKALAAHHLWKHRQHRRFMGKLGTTALALGRGKAALLFGALALGAEYMRRRSARTKEFPDYYHD